MVPGCEGPLPSGAVREGWGYWLLQVLTIIIQEAENVGKRKRWNEHLFSFVCSFTGLEVLGNFWARGVIPTFTDSK
eukprot:1798888-Amphidinium_carterae.1